LSVELTGTPVISWVGGTTSLGLPSGSSIIHDRQLLLSLAPHLRQVGQQSLNQS
jgi:hypothetical protein